MLEGDKGVSIASLSHGVPPDEDTNCGATDIHADHHVSEEDPLGDQVVVTLSGWLSHDVRVGRVE